MWERDRWERDEWERDGFERERGVGEQERWVSGGRRDDGNED